MTDVSDELAAKIDERRRKLDQVDRAIAEIRRLQHEREVAASSVDNDLAAHLRMSRGHGGQAGEAGLFWGS